MQDRLILVLIGIGLVSLAARVLPTVGALLAALGFGLWLRRFHRLSVEEAGRSALEKSDPARAQQLSDEHWAKQAAQEDGERAELWQRAPIDLHAARELRKRLVQDIRLNEVAKRGFGTNEELGRDLQNQLEKVEALIRSHSVNP